MRIWLAMDPETLRVSAQDHEFSDGDFPRGLRGLDWPRRDVEIPDEMWATMIKGARAENGYSPVEQDILHRSWWTQGGETEWPQS